MIFFPPAKINFGLKVLNKRLDGYHAVDTVMIPIPLFDILEIVEAERFSFISSGLEIKGEQESNLCIKAYKLLKEKYEFPEVAMYLRKEIPMGAGLGGGSSDAAFVLCGLNIMFNLGISTKDLEFYAGQLGSDCPFFIEALPKSAAGRGEVLSAVDLKLNGKWLVLVNPGLHISTKEAYENVRLSTIQRSCKEIVASPVELWKDALSNDFEHYAITKYPIIGELKTKLYQQGALYAAMSGSGSTLFGIFDHEPINIVEETDFFVRKFKL